MDLRLQQEGECVHLRYVYQWLGCRRLSTGRLAKQGPTTAVGPRRKAVCSKVCSKRKHLVNRVNFTPWLLIRQPEGHFLAIDLAVSHVRGKYHKHQSDAGSHFAWLDHRDNLGWTKDNLGWTEKELSIK